MTLQKSKTIFRPHTPRDLPAIQSLYVSVFNESEGLKEGALVGRLVKELITGTASRDLYGFVAVDGEQIVGAVCFSRLTCEKALDVFILSPMAVSSDQQGKGIGQALIRHGLRELKENGVRIVTTYGDPNFYAKVGFQPIAQDVIAPPLELSQPEGWLGQSLTGGAIEPIPGRCKCVEALDDPAYW